MEIRLPDVVLQGMADPLMQAICCQRPDNYSEFYGLFLQIDSVPYNVVCLLSSAIGIFGAIYQILPRIGYGFTHHWSVVTARRGREIIVWLAFADLLASVGVFFRSLMKIMMPTVIDRLKAHGLECIMFAFWIQYFYVVSWFWTLIYAIDMCLALKRQPSHRKIYHLISWLLPAIFTFIGLFVLYYPDRKCFVDIETNIWRFLPNYIVSYLPMLAVMIVNPVLYWLSARSVNLLVVRYLSQYTRKERHLIDAIRIKFALINLAFYVCWLPNVINTVCLYVLWRNVSKRTILSIWYVMAILNPLQALLNSLVYRKSQDRIVMPWSEFHHPMFDRYFPYEKTPLLARRNGSSNNSDTNSDCIL